jgi:arylsulfatase A-like enzyme
LKRRVSGVIICCVAVAALITSGNGSHAAPTRVDRPSVATATAPAARPDKPANMVLILMDDFSLELLATMPNAQRMAAEGATYRNAFVIDSLCCPSRAALLTGQTPHQTGVLTNTPNDPVHPIGGYRAFVDNGNPARQFAVALHHSGYQTGFVGKFMNGYESTTEGGAVGPPPKVPGWTVWNAILGGGYNGWGYQSTYLDESGAMQLRKHPVPPLSESVAQRDRQYSTNVASDLAMDFLETHRDGEQPYFLEIATYGPHSQLKRAYRNSPQFPSAFADRAPAGDPTGGNCGPAGCGALTLHDLAGYDDPRGDNAPTYLRRNGSTAPAPAWRTNPITLTDEGALTRYRDRARMVASIDRMIARVREAAGPDAYIFLTSDNGFHLGQHQLNGGKGTPYDSDTRVPLVVVGPGVVPGQRDQFVNNIDLAPTFEDLAGLRSPAYRAGSSFADTLTRPRARGAHYAFFEHTYAKTQPGEVDTDEGSGGTIDIIPSFIAIRGERGLLARFDLDPSWRGTDYAYELYRYDRPWEDRNVFAEDHRRPWARDLMTRLRLLDGCAPARCRAAVR